MIKASNFKLIIGVLDLVGEETNTFNKLDDVFGLETETKSKLMPVLGMKINGEFAFWAVMDENDESIEIPMFGAN